MPSLRGIATGGGRCCAGELPGRFVDRGGGAGLLIPDLGDLTWSFVGVCAVARLSLGDVSGGGERTRLGCGDTSGGGDGAAAGEG
jgi:hypothetical protein